MLRDEDCFEILEGFLKEKLGLTNSIYIQTAHRLGVPLCNKTPPIIACFRDYKDIESILSNAYKLKGENIGFNRDYPPEIVEARSRLWHLYKTARMENPRETVHIGYPANLIVQKLYFLMDFMTGKG